MTLKEIREWARKLRKTPGLLSAAEENALHLLDEVNRRMTVEEANELARLESAYWKTIAYQMRDAQQRKIDLLERSLLRVMDAVRTGDKPELQSAIAEGYGLLHLVIDLESISNDA